jgi:hypothetical protein
MASPPYGSVKAGVEARRAALIVASYEYQEPGLRRLRAPAQDAEALARVLEDPDIGGFDVRTILNQPAHVVSEAVEEFFADRVADDLLLLHFSCHGVKDEGGELYFAAPNTKLRRLGATAVAADFVNRRMNRSRSRRVVLLLDCCYAGAFERGMVARAGSGMDIEQQFGGRGRAVITASSAMEYAFEGDELADGQERRPSVFTSAVVEGLETGEADRDQDGYVGLDELYEYVYDTVRERTPNQTPGKWTYGVQGDLYIARRSRPVTKPAPLPLELQDAIDHPVASIRAGAVPELERLLQSTNLGLALGARLALDRLAEDDSRRVSGAANTALGRTAATVTPIEEPTVPAAIVSVAQVSTSPERPAGAPAGAPTAATRPASPAWMPALVVAGGWILAWPVSLGLAASGWATNLVTGAASALVGWVVASALVAAALRWVAPWVPLRRALLIAIGWPTCLLVGLAGPIVLRLSYQGAAVLAASVVAAGLLGALAQVPPGQPPPWDRLLVVAAGWLAGWLWSGVTAWPDAFWWANHNFDWATFGNLVSGVGFVQLAAGGAMSGVVGGILMYLLLRPTAVARST